MRKRSVEVWASLLWLLLGRIHIHHHTPSRKRQIWGLWSGQTFCSSYPHLYGNFRFGSLGRNTIFIHAVYIVSIHVYICCILSAFCSPEFTLFSFQGRQLETVLLVPELCYCTGLTDEIRSNFTVMKVSSQLPIIFVLRYVEINQPTKNEENLISPNFYAQCWNLVFLGNDCHKT